MVFRMGDDDDDDDVFNLDYSAPTRPSRDMQSTVTSLFKLITSSTSPRKTSPLCYTTTASLMTI